MTWPLAVPRSLRYMATRRLWTDRSALRSVGLPLGPRTVFVMLYEDNDFFGPPPAATGHVPLGRRIKLWIETSPLVNGVMSAAVALFGGVRADAPVRGFESVSSWMPATARSP